MEDRLTISFSVPRTAVASIAFQQAMDWLSRIGDTDPVAHVSNDAQPTAPVHLTLAQIEALSPKPVAAAEIKTEEAVVGTPELPQTAPIGAALPPGMDGPAKRNKGGRPKSAATLAKEAAEAAGQPAAAAAAHTAAGNGAALPPGMTSGARPPGVGLPAQPQVQVQQPAMPPQPEFTGGVVSKADLTECFNEAQAHDPKGVHAVMMARTWPGTTEPKPPMFTPVNVAPEYIDRLYRELAALIPAQA